MPMEHCRVYRANALADSHVVEALDRLGRLEDLAWKASWLDLEATKLKIIAEYIVNFRIAFKGAGLKENTLEPKGKMARGYKAVKQALARSGRLRKWKRARRHLHKLVPEWDKLEAATLLARGNEDMATLVTPQVARGHALCAAGPLLFCAVCGAYTGTKCHNLAKTCPGLCLQGNGTVRKRLLQSLHPVHKVWLGAEARLATVDDLALHAGDGGAPLFPPGD